MSLNPKILAGALIAVATVAAMYAVAAATASSAAAGFVTEEKSGHTRGVEFAEELKRVSAGYRAARAKCERLPGEERKTCLAELRSEVKGALRSLR